MLVQSTPTALEAAVGASAVALATALDNTRAPGLALYALRANVDMWYAQGIADTTFTGVASTDIFTATTHRLRTGMPVQVSNSGGALPSGLSTSTNYYAGVIDADTFYLYDTLAHAQAGGSTGKINITTNGTGTQTMKTVATAGAGSAFLPAGVTDYLDGAYGATVSIIEDSTGGKASIIPMMRV
jgi:hypothetical protein